MSTPPTLEDVYSGSGTGPDLPNPDKPTLVHTHPGEHHNDYATSVAITRATKIYALCAAVNSCNLGYDVGVNTNAGLRVQQDFNLSDTVSHLSMVISVLISSFYSNIHLSLATGVVCG